MAKHTTHKMLRWALRLSTFKYVFEFLEGSENVWADLLTRWAEPTKPLGVKKLLIAPLITNNDERFAFPLAEVI
jgi:hypothetical protein